MKVVNRAFWVLVVAFGGGCAAEAVPQESDPVVAKVEQAVTLFDCQAELGMCVRSARGLLALSQCTTKFATCNTRAANELLDETEILNDCRAGATDCLESALTTADVRSCRGIFRTCAEDAFTSAQHVLETAVNVAEDTIKKAADAATMTITNVAGIGSNAFDVLQGCREDAFDCLDGVTSTTGISACRTVFDGCATDAVNLAEDAVQLPLDAAGNLITCNAEFSTCVLTLNQPFDCAADAQACLGL